MARQSRRDLRTYGDRYTKSSFGFCRPGLRVRGLSWGSRVRCLCCKMGPYRPNGKYSGRLESVSFTERMWSDHHDVHAFSKGPAVAPLILAADTRSKRRCSGM